MYERAVTDNHVLLVILSTLLKYMYSSARPRTSRAFSSFAAAAHPQMSWIPAKKVTFKKREGKRHRLLLLYAFLLPAAEEDGGARRERLTPRPPLGIRIFFKPGIGNAHRFFKEIVLRHFCTKMLTVAGHILAPTSSQTPPTFHLANTQPPKLTQKELEERKRLMVDIRSE